MDCEMSGRTAYRAMPITRSHKGPTPLNTIPIRRFLHMDSAIGVQPIRERCRKLFRHVLHNHNSRRFRRQGAQNLRKCFRPASRSPITTILSSLLAAPDALVFVPEAFRSNAGGAKLVRLRIRADAAERTVSISITA